MERAMGIEPTPEGGKPTPLSKASKTKQEAEKAHKVGDHLLVTVSGGRIAEATVKAVVDTTSGVRLQGSFEDETALNYLWQASQDSLMPRWPA
jgi:hypothetical protein